MSAVPQTSRRLLWSILNASTALPLPPRSAFRLTSARTLTCTRSSRNEGSTFSFGAEGDRVIAELAARPQNAPSSRPERQETVSDAEFATKPKKIRRTKRTPATDGKGVSPVAKQYVDRNQSSQRSSTAPKPSRTPKRESMPTEEDRISTSKPSRATKTEKTPQPPRRKGDKFRKIAEEHNESLRAERRQSFEMPKPTRQPTPPSTTENDTSEAKRELPTWAIQKNALTHKFAPSGGWNPRRKLSPDAILGIKTLHASDPDAYTTPVLSQQFKISPEAIRRILRSKWLDTAAPEVKQERRERWAKRHDRIWDQQVALGLRPPRVKERKVVDASEGAEEVEERIWRERVLEDARREDQRAGS